MTTSIDKDHQLRPANPPEPTGEPANGVSWLVRLVQIVAAVSTLGGISAGVSAFTRNDWRTATIGLALIFVASCSGGICVINALLADRHAFYRRGLLDGWMRGWRGQEPDLNDPLLRQR